MKRTTHFFAYLVITVLLLVAVNANAVEPKPKSKPASPFKGEFVVTRTEDPVCIPLVKNLNEFRRHDFKECIPRVSKKYPQFKYPDWKEVPLDLEIAEKAFKGFSLFAPNGEPAATVRWQKWLKETETLRANGQIKMWLTEVDIDNDGVVDTIARVDRAHPALDRPIAERTCPITDSGLWMVKGGSKERQDHFNEMLRGSDIVSELDSVTSYTLDWLEIPDIYMDRPPKGLTGTLHVLISTAPHVGSVQVCNISWVPEGLLKKATPAKSAKPISNKPILTK